MLVPYPDHTVTMHFTPGVKLVQRRGARTSERRVRAGDVIVTPAGEPKTLRHDGEAEVLDVQLAPAWLEEIARQAGANAAASNLLKDNFGTRDTELAHLCRRFRAELEHEGIGGRLYAESIGVQLGLHLLRHYVSIPSTLDDGRARLPAHKLRRAVEYMNEHLREDLSLEQIAGVLSISPFHFAHLFKESTGLSPHRYLIDLRIQRAKSLLRETELPITEVAQQVGYWNNSHFAVAFHRATGFTPRAFRRNG
jgi:AraC family transcriptional regulator